MNTPARGPTFQRKTAFATASVLCLAAIIFVGCRSRTVTDTAETGGEGSEAVVVQTKPVEQRSIAQVVRATAYCEPLLHKSAALTPAVEGQVLAILAQPGDSVKKGQPIVQLDPRTANANLREKKAALNELLSALRLLKALPRPEEQAVERSVIEDARIGVHKAEAAVARLQPLLERNEIPKQQMLDAKLALQQAQIQQQKADAQFKVLMLGPRPEAVAQAQDRIAAADAAVATAQAQCDLLTIRSPIDGVLDKINCRLGQTVATGTVLGDVIDSRQLQAVLWLPPQDARLVRVGQTAQVAAPQALKDLSGQIESPAPVSGRVTYVGHVADPQTGNFPIRVLFDNAKRQFGVGQTVAAAITVREKKDALVVPASAVFDLEEGALLNVVRKGESVVLHPRIGIREKPWMEVEGTDLKAGEPVIVEGGWSLPEGTKVKEKEASDEPPAAEKSAEEKR
jgi:multidrug efflux pump subunit AcrA (membrane-fusion protein)